MEDPQAPGPGDSHVDSGVDDGGSRGDESDEEPDEDDRWDEDESSSSSDEDFLRYGWLEDELYNGGRDDDEAASSGEDDIYDPFAAVLSGLLNGVVSRIGIGPTSPILDLDDRQLEQLVVQVSHFARGLIVEHSDMEGPDVAAAERAARVVSRMPEISELTLDFHDGNDSDLRNVVDPFLEEMISNSPGAHCQLSRLSLGYLCTNLDTWRRFADRFGSGIETLQLGTGFTPEAMASEVALSLRSRFSSLQKLIVCVGAGDSNADSVKCLLGTLPHLAIKDLNVELTCYGVRRDRRTLVEVLNCVSEMAPLCKTLATLEIDVSECAEFLDGYDGSIILESSLRSVSLISLNIKSMTLTNANARPLLAHNARATNDTLKELCVTGGRIGEDSISLISGFKGLEAILFDCVEVTVDRRPGVSRTSLFESLQGLVSYSHRSRDNAQTLWLACDLSVPSLRSATVVLTILSPSHPALKEVLANCTGPLTVLLDSVSFESNVTFLCAGIEAARSLPSLDVEVTGSDVGHNSLASVLDSVQRNRSLRKFVGQFRAPSFARALDFESCLQAFVQNASLEHFGIGFHNSPRNRGRDAAVVAGAFMGLRRNRSIRTIDFLPRIRDWNGRVSIAPRAYADRNVSQGILRTLCEVNTTLQRIEGIQYESREDEQRIDEILRLNQLLPELVANHKKVPLSLWGDVLCRINTSDCNYFVTWLARQALGADRAAGDPEPEAGEPTAPPAKRSRRSGSS